MPEPGFAWALYYQVTRQPAAAKQAIDWALKDDWRSPTQVIFASSRWYSTGAGRP